MAFRLESFNFPDFFVRHHNFEGELNELDRPGPIEDFAWIHEERGEGDKGFTLVGLQSVNKPGHFLRHKNFRILLEPDDNSEAFRKDSTFRRTTGLSDDDSNVKWVSYESTNFPNNFIRHHTFHLFINERNAPNLKDDATFKRVTI